jgi:hypothetical protein
MFNTVNDTMILYGGAPSLFRQDGFVICKTGEQPLCDEQYILDYYYSDGRNFQAHVGENKDTGAIQQKYINCF